MIKYVNILDEKSGVCAVGTGENNEKYKALGMVRKDVEQSEVDGCWYLTAKCPHYTDEEKLEKVKAEKLAELSSVADNYAQYKCPIDMYITSSTGFKVDADVCSQTNMQGLILMLGEGESCQYKDFNNEFQTVTREQLTIMVGEAKQNGLSLYNQKFTFEAQINVATSIEEVEAIEIKFKMLDFSKSE